MKNRTTISGLLAVAWVFVVACDAPGQQSAPLTAADSHRNSAANLVTDYLLLRYTDEKQEGLKVAEELGSNDPQRAGLDAMLRRPFLQWVLRLGIEARKVALERCEDGPDVCRAKFDHPAMFVIVESGNRPKQGIALKSASGVVAYPKALYTEIDPRSADILMPHEYGHVIMGLVMPDELHEHPPILPHTTSAITDDVTAFSEGWGIHFETLAGEQDENSELRSRTTRQRFIIDGPVQEGDSFVAARDLLSYSQSYRRHTCIRENCFAYLPRFPSALVERDTADASDLIARWTDSSVDYANLRTIEQMVASEGVVATLFYRLARSMPEHAQAVPDLATYRMILTAFSRIKESEGKTNPTVLLFVEELMKMATPEVRNRIARIVLEVFHYTPMIRGAPIIYQRLYTLGSQIDIKAAKVELAANEQAFAQATTDLALQPERVRDLCAPELWVGNPALTLSVDVFGMKVPLNFDINTAPPVFLMSLDGVSATDALAIASCRKKRGGFRSLEDLSNVDGLRPQAAKAIRDAVVPESPRMVP